MRIRFTVTSRQAASILGMSALAFLALLGLGLTQLSWPWFSLWLLLLLGVAIAAGSGWCERVLGLRRPAAWLLLLAGGALMNLHLYWIQLHRQRSERLDVTGVYLQPPATFTIGAGEAELDVRLAGALTEQERWRMRVRREGQGFRIEALDGVDWVDARRGDLWTRFARLRGLAGGRSDWRPVWGSEIGRERRAVPVRDAAGATTALVLRGEGPRGTIEWRGRRARLDMPGSSVLDRRLARALRRGATLDELPWDGPVPAGADRIAITMRDAGVASPLGRIRWPRYRVAARGDGLAISATMPSSAALAIGADDTLRVGSRGRVWAFALRSAPPMRWRSSDVVQLLFVQRPTARGWALPAPDECEADGACAIVSSHPLPPPIAHFDLSGFGLDTARYALLGRLDRLARADSLRLVTDTSSRMIAFGEVQPVEARRLRPDLPAAGFLLRVHRPEASDWASLAWTLVGLATFLVLCGRAIARSPLASGWLAASGPHATAAWLLVNLTTVLLSVRLLLGLRVTYAAPFYERGAATAIGLWLAVGSLCVVLAWWPVLWHALLRLSRRGPVIATTTGVAAPHARPPRRAILGALLPPLAVALVIVATTLRLEDAMGVVLVVSLALLAWLAVAVSEIAAAPEQLGDHPLSMLTAETTAPGDLRATLAITATLGLGVAVASRAPIASIVLAMLFVLATLAPRALRRWRARRTSVTVPAAATAAEPDATAPAAAALPVALRAVEVRAPVRRAIGWGAALVTLVGVARLLDLLQGPTLLLGIIVMLFLLAVRAGVLSARRFGATGDAGGKGTHGRLALLSALMLPIGALALAGLFDVGLALVVFVPLFVTVLLAASAAPMGRSLAAGAALLFVVAAWGAASVLFPSTRALERAGRVDVSSAAARFERMGGPVARLADLSEPTRVAARRAIVRGLAARRPDLLEQLLPAAGPSEARDEIIPSLEQAWGGRAYAASGATGAGFARTASFGRGISAATSYAENAFAVYVLSEHGAVGGLAVLALYAAFATVILWWALRFVRGAARSGFPSAALAVVAGGTLLLVLPAAYVALSNIGVVPLTGQNMPFLGLNAWSDVLFVAAIVSAMLSTLTSLAGAEAAA